MAHHWVLEELAPRRPSRVSPEWGCGGVYGLHYTGDTLYYTVAFDAVAFFHSRGGGVERYDYRLLGPAPRSGGDTYNVSTSVDDEIYFGGWVHAPARLLGGEVDFSNKYSHVHAYSSSTGGVRLLWSESLHHPRLWAGEVTSLLYNPLRDSLLAARGDGHQGLGVYELGRRGGARKASDTRVLRGTTYMDHACFSLHHGWGGSPGVHCLDLETMRGFTEAAGPEASVDGAPPPRYRSGDTASAYTWLMVLARGGLYRFDPFGGEPPAYVRLLDLGDAPYGPLRVNTLPVAGGLLAAFNAQSHSTIRGTEELPRGQQRASRRPPAPSLLVYLSPPSARIVAALGARTTSMEHLGCCVLLATSTCPNLERRDATMVDHSVKTFEALPVEKVVTGTPPPVSIRIPGGRGALGGVPLEGYRRPLLRVRAPRRGASLRLHLYRLDTGPGGADEDRVGLEPGWNTVDLGGHGGSIVSLEVDGGPWEAELLLR